MDSQAKLPGGVFTATLTPVNPDYSVNEALLISHCQHLLDKGSTGIALLGTTGEANSFSLADRKKILERTIAGGIAPDKLMVGTGCCALKETIELTKHATEHGVGGVLMLPPYYYKAIDESGVEKYFDEVIAAVGSEDLKIYLYHFPKMSSVPFSIPLIQKLIDKYPKHIVGIKDSTGDIQHTRSIIEAIPNFQVFAGTEALLLDTLKAGGAGCISATANLTCHLAVAVLNAFKAGEAAEPLQDYATKVRTSFQGLPFSGTLKTYLAEIHQENGWATVIPPNEPLDNSRLESLYEKLESLDFPTPRNRNILTAGSSS